MGSVNSIAREAGCSPSTVSRVINGCRKGFSVSKELEDRILGIAKRFDYRPNPYLRALKAKRTRLVAILDVPYSKTLELERGKMEFIKAIRQAGLTESLKYVERDNPDEHVVEFPVDAALLFDVGDKSTLRYFETAKIPYAVFNGLCGPGGVSLLVDEAAGAKLLLELLFSLGHKRIAYANKSGENFLTVHYSVTQREKQYLETMRENGLAPLPEHWNRRIGAREFVETAMRNGATAIVCYHHMKALEIMHAAWTLGIRVPERLSVACFNNDEELLSWSIPPLTCVSTPGQEMGAAAASLIVRMLDGSLEPAGQSFKFAGSLIVRQSTAEAPK